MSRACLVLLASIAAGCGSASRPASAAPPSLAGVWVAVGTLENPAGPPPRQNTVWPAQPPFTPEGETAPPLPIGLR